MRTSVRHYIKKRERFLPQIAMLVVAAILCGLFVFSSDDAYALRVTMKRVIFEGPRRTELLTIVNNTAEEQTYRLGWRRMSMSADKSLVYLEDDQADPAGLLPADKMIRYAPRRVVLAPGASQQVRLMLRRPKDLPEGEYRSHFWIQPEADSVKFSPDEIKSNQGKGPSIQIKMLTGMTLPVFVRNGKVSATGSITDGRVQRAGDNFKISFTLNREGNRSLYGNFEFLCNGADGPLLRQLRGLAVYTEIEKRMLAFEIPASTEDAPSCSQVHVKYVAIDDDSQFKGATIAEATIPVN